MPRVLAPSPAEAEKDPEEQGWAARQGAGEGPGWAWPCPPPQNPAGCTLWRQDPRSPNSHQHPVGSTLWSCHPWVGHPSVAGWGSHPSSTGCPRECGIPTGIARARCRTPAQHWTGDSPCVASTHGTAGTLVCSVGGCPWPPRAGRGPRVVLAGGSQGREAREELFMFAGAKCLLGTAPAVPGPNYSTRSGPPTQRQPGTKRGQRRRAGYCAPQ